MILQTSKKCKTCGERIGNKTKKNNRTTCENIETGEQTLIWDSIFEM